MMKKSEETIKDLYRKVWEMPLTKLAGSYCVTFHELKSIGVIILFCNFYYHAFKNAIMSLIVLSQSLGPNVTLSTIK